MNQPPNSLFRRLIGLRAATASREADPADMGTAIGLEFSMDQPPLQAPAHPPAHPVAAQARRPGTSRSWFTRGTRN